MESLGGCRILEEVGRGAVGTVYKARWSERMAALKVLSEDWSGNPDVTERFVKEGLIMRQLSHPGIVKVFDAGCDDGRFYIVLEFVEGPSFEKAIRHRAFTLPESARIVAAVGRALHHAHARGVVHSDIVPGNILLKGDGTPKVTDFGIARVLGGGTDRWKSGVTAGTPVYMSPEQAAGLNDVIDTRTDVYSLGAVLYEAVTGRPPFSGRSTLEILERVRDSRPQTPRECDPSVPKVLEGVIVRAMDKDPDRRYPTAEALAGALEQWAETQPDLFGS